MFYCPYYKPYPSIYRQNENTSYVRVFHASPNAPAVDVYINNNPVSRSLSFKGFSQYQSLQPGLYNFKIYPAGRTDTPVIDTNVNIPAKSIYTAAAIGELPNISLDLILEPLFQRVPGRAYIRFAHLSPNAPAVDIVLPNGRKLFSDITYKEVANYISLTPGKYTLNINLAGTNNRVLYVPNIRLLPNRIYTIYAVGLAGRTPPLQVVIPLDGNTYLTKYPPRE